MQQSLLNKTVFSGVYVLHNGGAGATPLLNKTVFGGMYGENGTKPQVLAHLFLDARKFRKTFSEFAVQKRKLKRTANAVLLKGLCPY